MISLSTLASSIIASGTYRYYCSVQSWLGDELLSDNIPISAGTENVDRAQRVPERITLAIPRYDRGFSWAPTTDNHPLAANGQRLLVQLGIDLGNNVVEWFSRGWFRIQNSDPSGDEVQVEALGLLSLIDMARLVSPYQPSGTLVSTLRGLVEPALTVYVDSGLTDRAVPGGINYDEDRLGAVMELLDAWGADAWVTEDGYLSVVPMGPSLTPVLTLTDGLGGTVIEANGASTSDDAFNVVVARGTAADGGQVQGVAYDFTSAIRYGGDFNPLPVPYFYSSPLVTTVPQATSAAQTILSRLKRSTSREFQVEMVPHPGLQAGDTVSITTDDYSGLAVVEKLTLGYTNPVPRQTLTVRALS
ncbi:DUF5047 domain-containing protein [Micromonospora sp. C72]|uniref:DUF5047 domain-containing protein n=1 Tax=Micromonospora sp. C72 TaxID=2824880 RepID=UPI001B37B69C|nr:DUF5047 domain-containing protein [Micromonospora sp. C72]MBQ1042362.1 DUF5047 domain-containing protein [Micromonospora sp. C72]